MWSGALITGTLLGFGGCSRGFHGTRFNIVVITLDTTRADHLSTYGYFRKTSPNLDDFARESILFENLIVPMATTLPSHMSLFTGTYPLEHGVLANITQGGERFVPASKLRTFASLSREAGYATAAFVSATSLKAGSGAETGFDVYEQPERSKRNSKQTTDAALSWLEKERPGPFFLWVHYFDAHYPSSPPARFEGMYHTDEDSRAFIAERKISPTAIRSPEKTVSHAERDMNIYDAEISFMDSQLGRLVQALRNRPDWNTTAVVVVGDHGEGLCQHGIASHGHTWNEQLHAPLILRIPGKAPRRVSVPISGIDVLPTLMGLVDCPQKAGVLAQASGRDVLAEGPGTVPILAQDTGRDRGKGVPFRYALYMGAWKFFRIESSDGKVRSELYDLASDPYELDDLASENPEKVRAMSLALETMLANLENRGKNLRNGREPATRAETPEILEELKALGYVEGGD